MPTYWQGNAAEHTQNDLARFLGTLYDCGGNARAAAERLQQAKAAFEEAGLAGLNSA